MKTKTRRYDLDWLRVLVFGLLIFYHVGMFFVPWGWHIKNDELVGDLRWPMLFVNQWRLSILFVISGMGTCFALAHWSGGVFRWERIRRLGIPLIVGMLLIVPPQIYIERLVNGQFEGSYWTYLTTVAFSGVYPEGNISWHHLWFLPYLLFYSLLLSPVFVYFKAHPNNALLSFFRRLLQKPYGIYYLCLPVFLTDALLEPFFNVNHAFIGDWFALTEYGILFFYGFLLITIQEEFWKVIHRIRFGALAIGLGTFTSLIVLWHLEDGVLVHFATSFVRSINLWSWIIVLFAFSAIYLNRPSVLLSYCNKAVYPFYILHQTITLLIGYMLMNAEMKWELKFVIMCLGTFFGAWIIYELLIRRIPFLWPLFGLKTTTQSKNVPAVNSLSQVLSEKESYATDQG